MATVLEPSLARGPAPESSDRSFGFVFAAMFAIIGCLPLLHLGSPRWWAFGIAAVFGLLAIIRPQPPASSQSGMARARATAAPDRKPARHGRGLFPLRHADRVDHAAARQGRVVACAPSRFVELLDRPGAIAAGTRIDETAILNAAINTSNVMSILVELWEFLRVRKKFWLAADCAGALGLRRPDHPGAGIGRRSIHLHAVLAGK